MIIPCIDLMDGKVVQLIQGREKALEGKSPEEMLALFVGIPEIQVIDLDAAMDKGSNDAIVKYLAKHARVRVGGGVRTLDRALELVNAGADRVIVGTAAFSTSGPKIAFLNALRQAIGADRIRFSGRPGRGDRRRLDRIRQLEACRNKLNGRWFAMACHGRTSIRRGSRSVGRTSGA
ncbi:hypothetical protein B4Q13_20550 [Lacticaseibacillus rhamnosus]